MGEIGQFDVLTIRIGDPCDQSFGAERIELWPRTTRTIVDLGEHPCLGRTYHGFVSCAGLENKRRAQRLNLLLSLDEVFGEITAFAC